MLATPIIFFFYYARVLCLPEPVRVDLLVILTLPSH